MAFERGGRTDKFGNRYEDRYVVNRMIALLREQISSITIEPVGEDESGVDLLIDKGNGIQEFHQCKARNDDSDRWTLASLAKHKMFAHIREHVKSKNEFYIWVSPLTFIGLSDLCTAARNSPSADIFYNFQLSLERKKLFDQIRNRLGLSESEDGVEQTLFYLQQIEFAQIPDNTLSAEMDCQNLESLFIGDGETIYDVLINFPKRDYYGKPITALTLVQYLEQRGFQRRTYADNIKISAKIQDLNNEFADWFHPIKEFLFETVAAQRIIQNIENETNVLLLGAAGSGKSGCVGVLQKYLENNHIPYLAIKLDKHPPAYSIDQYSKDLELPISPVLALERMVAKESVGVLILDQLDSLRWTSAHSETALPICKKMLMQARGVSDKKIIVVLVSRAFDFENDTELKALCSDLQEWSIIHVEPWDENTVKQLVGADIFVQLPPQTRKLLQSPNNLAIWMNLDSDLRYSAFKGSTELIESWLQQTRKHITQHDISRVALDDCLKKLLRCSRKSSAVPRSILNAEEAVIDFCLSEGLLYQNKSTVSFSHQSIADYLNVEQNLNAIYEQDIPVSATLPEFDKQLPNIRIQTQMLWLKLLDGEESFFLAKGREFLESEGIRFYYKCTFWEALGQSDSPGENAFGLIRQYWGDTAWHDFLYRVVFCGHFPFACHYVSYGFAETWMEPQALQLLSTIFTQEPEFVLDCLEPYAFQNEQTDRDIYQCFSFSPTEKSDRVFSFRMRILKKYPEWGMESYQFGDLVQLFPLRAIEYLKFFLSECISFFDHSTHDISDDFLKLSQTHPQEVIEELADAVSDIAPSEPSTAIGLYQWTENRERLSAQRFFAKLIEKALFVMLQKDFKWTKNFIVQHLHPKSLLEQEWLLKLIATVFNSLPFDELVSAIQYFLGDFDTESDMSVSTAFCEILRNHALTPWPANFYERLCFLARFHSNPSPEQYALTSHDDPNHSSSESLAGNSLNCVRGYAFYAISNVLKEHPDLETVFFDVLQQGLLDPHPAVRYSLMDCLCQVYSINQELACNWFCALLEQDIRVLSHPLAPYLVLYDFDRHHDLYQKAIGEAFEGSDSDLAKKGAIIAAALYKEKNKMNELLFRNSYTADQLEGLGIQLGYYAWSADNTHAKEALMHILEYCEKVPSSILRECFDPEHVLRVEPEITRSVIGKKLDSNGKSVILYAFKQLNSSAFYRLRGLIYLCCQKMCTCHDEQKYFVIRDVPELLFRLLDLPELTEQELADYLSLFDLAYQHSAITTNDLLQKTQK